MYDPISLGGIGFFGRIMMTKLQSIPIVLLLCFLFGILKSTLLHANEFTCDCTEIIGKCSGAITDIKNEKSAAQKTSYITFNVRSNHLQCSKVEYYIDNTPHQSVFRGGLVRENAFGVNSSTKLEYSSCKICKLNKKNNDQDDIDALMEKAKKEGDARIDQANMVALKKIDRSISDYNSSFTNFNSSVNDYGQSRINSTSEKKYKLSNVSKTSDLNKCPHSASWHSAGVPNTTFIFTALRDKELSKKELEEYYQRLLRIKKNANQNVAAQGFSISYANNVSQGLDGCTNGYNRPLGCMDYVIEPNRGRDSITPRLEVYQCHRDAGWPSSK